MLNSDSLYRVSFKCLIIRAGGEVLVVKERGRQSWELPGGGIEHGETIDESIRRELREEVAYTGGFRWRVMVVHDPVKLRTRDIWQLRIVVLVNPDNFEFDLGDDADAVKFVNPLEFADSTHESESIICEYAKRAQKLQ